MVALVATSSPGCAVMRSTPCCAALATISASSSTISAARCALCYSYSMAHIGFQYPSEQQKRILQGRLANDLLAGIADGAGHRRARVYALFLDGCSNLHGWLATIADEA